MVSLELLGRERTEAQTCVTVFSCSEPINTATSCFFLQHRWGVWYHRLKQFMDLSGNCLALGMSPYVWGLISLYCPCSESKFLETLHLFCSLQLSVRHRTLTSNVLKNNKMLNFQLEPLKVLLLQCYSYSPQLQHSRDPAVYLPFPSTVRSSHSPDPELDDCFLHISGCQEGRKRELESPFSSVSQVLWLFITVESFEMSVS